MFEFIFECWKNVFLVHAPERWKKEKGKRFLYFCSYPFKILKFRFLSGRGRGGGSCTERDITQEGSRERT